jgi:hypothetical protein
VQNDLTRPSILPNSPPFHPFGSANGATKPSNDHRLPRLDLKTQSDTEHWSETDHQASICKLEEEWRLEQYKALYQATRSNKRIAQGKNQQGWSSSFSGFLRSETQFHKVHNCQGMKSPTVNLPSVVTYSSPISESLSRQYTHPESFPYCTVPLSPSTSKQILDLDLKSEGREASNHLFGTVKIPKKKNVYGQYHATSRWSLSFYTKPR